MSCYGRVVVETLMAFVESEIRENVIPNANTGTCTHKWYFDPIHRPIEHFFTISNVTLREVETFWQLIKDLGIMLDMKLSIRDGDSERQIWARLTGFHKNLSGFKSNRRRRSWNCWDVSRSVKTDERRKITIKRTDANNENILVWSVLGLASWASKNYRQSSLKQLEFNPLMFNQKLHTTFQHLIQTFRSLRHLAQSFNSSQ